MGRRQRVGAHHTNDLCAIKRAKKAGGLPAWLRAKEPDWPPWTGCRTTRWKLAAATTPLAGSMSLLACVGGSCSLYLPHTFWQQKWKPMRMIKGLPGKMLGWYFSVPGKFVHLRLDALCKKAMKWSSLSAPDPQRAWDCTVKVCKALPCMHHS